MDFSDDEGDTMPHAVSNYHFFHDKDEPISFSELPFQWDDSEIPDGKKKQIFLRGTTDNGLQKICKQVVAWKFNLSETKPEISVLCKENNWVKLERPRKSFEDTIRTILITVECLHFVKKNPETFGRALWDHLSKVFSLYEPRPSQNDLVDHMNLISEVVKRDEVLTKSRFLVTLLEEKPMKRKVFDEDDGRAAKFDFIVDNDIIDEVEDDGSDDDGGGFDTVCAICDNGGELLSCEGRCFRSFHATVEAGADSMCESLGFSDEQVKAMQSFYCKNCEYKQHQCFSCGKLGSSDKSSGTEVFSCVSATCGRFYHPHCVAKLIHRDSEVKAKELQEKIAAGETFTCPIHYCYVCKQVEDEDEPELQFAICRRCPKAYHRKCLPKKISFEEVEDQGIMQRAWEGLLPKRILIYCLKHEIDDELATPVRNHIIFPGVSQKKQKQQLKLPSSGEKIAPKGKYRTLEDAPGQKPVTKPLKGVDKLSLTVKQSDSFNKSEGRLSRPAFSKKEKLINASRKSLSMTPSSKISKATASVSKTSLGERLFDLMNTRSFEPDKSKKEDIAADELEKTETAKPVAKEINSPLSLDVDMKRTILTLAKNAASSITLEEIMEKHKLPTTHAYSSKFVVDKTITLGKVEGSIEALRAALVKLEEGCSIEDAKAVCEPRLINQIIKWKNKLKVYLAPFLYGMRYTSFGRHFTKVDKLKEVVEKLHHYVQDGDMMVDFCCGANDFSCLMKKKLDETGKKCLYKNYDVLQAKNDFNFEKRDWMSVCPKELPSGSQLIMGLNPPFGVNASLANKFINKALEFKPKLLILIVPPETERLDVKKSPYDLVWEDDELLAGKSFYLPGSVDVNDKQLEDWNLNTPPLFLWSRPDWTAKHKAIAQQHGHLSRIREALQLEENQREMCISDPLLEQQDNHDETSMLVDDRPVQNDDSKELQKRRASVTGSHNEGFNHANRERETRQNQDNGKNESENSKKSHHGEGKRKRGEDDTLSEDRQRARRSVPRHSSPSAGKMLDGLSSKPVETASSMDVQMEGYRHFDHRTFSESQSQFQTGTVNQSDDVAARYGLNIEEPYLSSAHGWPRASTPASGTGYGVRNSEEPYMGYRREGADPLGYGSGSYISEVDDKYGRETDMQSLVRLYGLPDPGPLNQRSSYFGGQDPGYSTPSMRLGSSADPCYSLMNTSAMQRYAPRLDELNHTRMNSLGSEGPFANRNTSHDTRTTQPGFRADSLGFAPGPYRPFSQQNSSGWLKE